MLRFKIDENMPVEAAELFIAAGHDASTAAQQQLGGKPDPNIAEACRRENRAIVTLDLDFGDIRAYPPADYAGIIVLRLHRIDKLRIHATLSRLLSLLSTEPLNGKLWIVDDATVRIRG